MTKIVLDMSMSLDGFICGPEDDVSRLHDWQSDGRGGDPRTFRPSGLSAEIFT